MEIDIVLLSKYCVERVPTIKILFETTDDRPVIAFAIGETKRFLSYHNLEEILLVNRIIGTDGILETIDSKRLIDKDSKRESAIYDTLAKYVLQLLFASRGKNLYPGIIPLDQHKADFNLTQEVTTLTKQ